MMDVDYKKVGLRISQRRKELGLKQKELAEKADYSNNYICNIENGRAEPTIEALLKICIALEVTPDYCLLGSIRPNNVSKNLIDSIQLCSEDSLKMLEAMLEAILNIQYAHSRR